jgi:hypothetical protein
MTLAADRRREPAPQRSPADRRPDPASAPPSRPTRPPYADQPVEFWPTSAIHAALEGGDIATWKKIAAALKRDPYGRTARQVEEVLGSSRPYGISRALAEVLDRARAHLEANEREEVARHVRLLMERSGLGPREFASRIGVSAEEFAGYLGAQVSPSASLMIRMRRLSDRFAKVKTRRPPDDN